MVIIILINNDHNNYYKINNNIASKQYQIKYNWESVGEWEFHSINL